MPRCPKCRGHMNQHEATSHYGTRLFIFQCPECLGIWLDGETVGAISLDSAIEAEVDVDFEAISTEPRTIGIFCPRCEINLLEQAGGSLPAGLRIDYCTKCNGYWFDRGELMIYKGHIERKRQNFKKDQDKKIKENLLKKNESQSRLWLSDGEMLYKFLHTRSGLLDPL